MRHYTLKQIMDIGAKDVFNYVQQFIDALDNKQSALLLDNRRNWMHGYMQLMMSRIKWHLLKLEPGPDTYKVID